MDAEHSVAEFNFSTQMALGFVHHFISWTTAAVNSAEPFEFK